MNKIKKKKKLRGSLLLIQCVSVRRLYPVDMKRVNEFGVSYEDQEEQEKPHKD